MANILGLDLGTNSIGWALINEQSQEIVDTGVKIFQAGVENIGDGEKEESRNAQRRQARAARKQLFRRKIRKKKLLRLLQAQGMAPESESLKYWFAINPYAIRSKAVFEKITLPELGRVFYHMAQRRGFLSNSRSANAALDTKSKISEGNPAEGKVGIEQTRQEMNDQTLGQTLYEKMVKQGEPYKEGSQRVRNRYTIRDMYTGEFEKIWNCQQQYHSELNTDLKEVIGGRKKEGYPKDGILFFQRELRSQKHLVGKCSLEKNKTRIPLSAIPFEKYRAWAFINNIRYNGQPLIIAQREQAFEFLMTKDSPKFSQLRKKLKLDGDEYQFNHEDGDKCPGAYTISKLSSKNYFGKSWQQLGLEEQEVVWHTLYFFDDQDKLIEYAQNRWQLDEVNAKALSKLHLKDGFGSLSRKAINNILPFLEMGFQESEAIGLGGVRNAFAGRWEQLRKEERQLIIDNVPAIISSREAGGFLEPLKRFLQTEFHLEERQLSKLYHTNISIQNGEAQSILPLGKAADKEIQQLRNPVVITALFELRRLVNTIIKEHGKPLRINVEMARELKSGKKERAVVKKKQRDQETYNRYVEKELEKLGILPTYESRLKYKLWQECQRTCPYTGKEINLEMLYRTGEVQIEHIFPLSRSNDDSYLNKTLCFADENRRKGDKTPYEFYNGQGWQEVKARALQLFKRQRNFPDAYKKFERFAAEKFEENFAQRQLNDTRYISREARKYLQKICKDVIVASGGVTARLRHLWGMNNILFEETKDRTDHRHHAIDALVMACMKARYVQQLAHRNQHDKDFSLEKFPTPWEGYWQDAKEAVDKAIIVHRADKRVLTVRQVKVKKEGKSHKNKSIAARGTLHKETVYGKRTAPGQRTAYHIRKSLQEIQNEKHVAKIADKQIQKLIIEHLKGLHIDTSSRYSVPADAFFTKQEDGSLRPRLFLPNKNGDPVPIKKVRLRVNLGKAERLKESNQWVNPRNNHHILIYKDKQGELQEEVITFWIAAERKRQRLPVVQLPPNGEEKITTLQINDMFILGLTKEEIDWNNPNRKLITQHIYRVQKLSSKFYEFRLHSESTLDKNQAPYSISIRSLGEGKAGWLAFNPIKVKLDNSGKLSLP